MSDSQQKIIMDKPNKLNLDKSQFHKMVFIMNALEKGWTIKKKEDKYIFTKKHENKKEIFEENYLERFVLDNSIDNSFINK
tara:strand:- start:388 stop:630 length:243 start_codon:yes stop_codon:yes gene_type:complete